MSDTKGRTNPFIYSNTNKRYHTLDYHLKERFGGKVFKISLNGGFTCPNRDGSKGVGGCSYCSLRGSGDFAGNPKESISQQFENIRAKMDKKWQGVGYIAYFQAFTGTYADTATLKKLYDEAVSQKDVVALFISTRPDCINKEIAELLSDYAKRYYLVVELGLQSIHDETTKALNRCHSYAEFEAAFFLLREHGVNVCVHIINGLPGEDREMMMQSIQKIALLKPHSVKIHMLHLLQGTKMGEEYKNSPYELLSRDEYVNLVCDQLEILPPEIIVQRLTGDGSAEDLIAPLWTAKKVMVLNEIDKELAARGSCQGSEE